MSAHHDSSHDTQHNITVVTGGTRGLGASISATLHKQGYRVVALYASNKEVADRFHQDTKIPILQCDVANLEQVEHTFAKIKNEHGTISVLVNNAGITRDKMIHRMSVEDWRAVIATNLDSLFYTVKQVIGPMRDQKFGRIVNITSVNAQLGQLGQSNYVASKSGMIGFSKSLALETARFGITVNCVAPGYTDTDMVRAVDPKVLQSIVERIPVQRLGQAEEIARTIVFLVSRDASFITGATINVNGGQYMN